jgi:multiple sugar transport system ATP-binding protein
MNFIDVTVQAQDGRPTLAAERLDIPVPDRFREAAAAAVGGKLVLGIRPEHFELAEGGSPSGTITTQADVVEYLGNEELIHIDVAGVDSVALLSSDHRVRPGDSITMTVNPDKLHLFDSETSLSLAKVPVQA